MSGYLRYDAEYMTAGVTDSDINEIMPEVRAAHDKIENRSGEGSDFLGWSDLPERITEPELDRLVEVAGQLNAISDVIVVIGIGGSYLGAKAAIETLTRKKGNARILFAGYNISCSGMKRLLARLSDRDVGAIVISKSGTTTEPAIAFRFVEKSIREKYGAEGAADRIVCVTDASNGALRKIADTRGYKTFVIPDDIGGRFSVLTPVGLLPIACAAGDIKRMVAGARDQMRQSRECNIEANPSYKYAVLRNILYRKGKKIEILSSFDSRLHYTDEWWKQLFGESEGKGGRSIFPASCDFSTDLHSLGQLIQSGERNIFETFLMIDHSDDKCEIPANEEDLDGLNYLAGRGMREVNRKAYEATREAHYEGGVPNSTVFLENDSAYCLGRLFYFFERAVALSAYMFGVNPFDQPGVEAYKKKMFKLLGKPGA